MLIMPDSTKEKVEKAKVLRKLMKKWLTRQDTKNKANLLLAKNPEIRMWGIAKNKKAC
jgi:hypothetical protein